MYNNDCSGHLQFKSFSKAFTIKLMKKVSNKYLFFKHLFLRTCAKPPNYFQLSLVTQGPEGIPSTFLERLREAWTKHTSMTSNSYEGQLIPRDKLITQSALDIWKKLQKIPLGSENILHSLF
jgi:hypothetical protein